MANYDKNFKNMLTGNLGLDSLLDVGGEKKPPTPAPVPGINISTNKTRLDTMADIRDSIATLVGSGYTGQNTNPNVKAQAARLMGLLDQKTAQNLLTHIIVQNQNTGNNKLTPTQRLQNFYDVNATNPQVNSLLQQTKSFGTGGATGGLIDSNDVTNMGLTNR